MSDPIKVGDLVYVYKDCCGLYLGFVFTVYEIIPLRKGDTISCTFCSYRREEAGLLLALPNYRRAFTFVPVEWLKKFRPLQELEGIETKEKVDA